VGEALLEAVKAGTQLTDGQVRATKREEFERELRPAVALVTAWLGQVGRDLRIDPALLATRHDLAAFLNDEPDARLASGWRGELLGRPLKALVQGEFALAFDGRGGLELERRSGQPVLVDLPRPTAPWTRE
jgi:ribonuclease D